MRGFWIAVIGLVASVMFCGGSFFTGNTGLVLPLAMVFYVMSVLTAFNLGRSVDIQSPFVPRNRQSVSRPAPRPTSNGTKRIQRLQERDDEFA